jgi:hypothetical protein
MFSPYGDSIAVAAFRFAVIFMYEHPVPITAKVPTLFNFILSESLLHVSL